MSVCIGAPYAPTDADASALSGYIIRMTGGNARGRRGRMPSPTKPLNAGYDPDKVRTSIKAVLRRLGTNPRALSLKARIAEGALRKFLNGGSRSPELETIMCLAAAVGMTTSEFIGESSPASEITDEQMLELRRLVINARQVQLQQSAQLDDVLAQLARLLRQSPSQSN